MLGKAIGKHAHDRNLLKTESLEDRPGCCGALHEHCSWRVRRTAPRPQPPFRHEGRQAFTAVGDPAGTPAPPE